MFSALEGGRSNRGVEGRWGENQHQINVVSGENGTIIGGKGRKTEVLDACCVTRVGVAGDAEFGKAAGGMSLSRPMQPNGIDGLPHHPAGGLLHRAGTSARRASKYADAHKKRRNASLSVPALLRDCVRLRGLLHAASFGRGYWCGIGGWLGGVVDSRCGRFADM